MIVTIVLIIIAFAAGVALAGKVASAWGGLKTEIALLKLKAATDVAAFEQRVADLESKIASKLP